MEGVSTFESRKATSGLSNSLTAKQYKFEKMTTNTNTTRAVKWTPPWGSALPPPIQRQATDEELSSLQDQTETDIQYTRPCSSSLLPQGRCPVCLEEKQMAFSICSCQQKVCHACHTAWFDKKPTAPCCPVCAKSVDREQLLQTLGIEDPLINKSPTSENSEDDETMDSLTHDWLRMAQDDAKRCPDCNIWIVKDGGCEHVTCSWCDFEFCWHCLAQIDDCNDEHDEEDDEDDNEGDC